MIRFISFVRIFYTVIIILYGLALYAITLAFIAAKKNGHIATASLLWQSIPYVLFVLLLMARIMQSRDPRWLWLGLPTIVVILGCGAYIFWPSGF